jgi:hypothetical protein
MSDDVIMVRMDDVRAAHMCSRGCREFCARYGIDWPTFLHEGVSSVRLEEIGDGMALQALERARERRAAEAEAAKPKRTPWRVRKGGGA